MMKKLRRDSIEEDDYTISDYGWDDRIEGKAKSDNPYAINNWKYYEWEKGWLMSDESTDISDTFPSPKKGNGHG